MGSLYQIGFPNGKSYIGVTAESADMRFAEHVYNSTKSRERAIERALRKYGAGNVKLNTLLIASDWQYLLEMERRAITAFQTFGRGGYNMTNGGEGALGYKHTPESLLKMGAIHKGKAHHNMPHSAETRAMMSANRRGKKKNLSQEQRERRSAIMIGNKIMLGRKLSEKTKHKMSESHTGKVFSAAHLANISIAAFAREAKHRERRKSSEC